MLRLGACRTKIFKHELQRALLAPHMVFGKIRDVDALAIDERRLLALAPSQNVNARVQAVKLKLQVLPLLADLPRITAANAVRRKERLGISHAVRLQKLDLRHHLLRNLLGCKFQLDVENRHEILFRQHLCRISLHSLTEGSNVRRAKRKPRRLRVAAKAQKMLPAGRKSFKHVEAAYAAARPLADAVFFRDDDRRTVIALDDARGHDADDAGMPAFSMKHEHMRLLDVNLLDLFFCRLQDLLLHGLTLAIRRIKLLRNRLRFLPILRQEQFDAAQRGRQASRRIEPRREHEADMSGRDLLLLEFRHSEKRLNTRTLRFLQDAQTLLHDLPIFLEERHNVGDRAQGDDVKIAREGLAAHFLPKRLAELERHAHARDVLVGI